MTDRRVALLRGVNNAGPSTRISMSDLRKVFETLGHHNVRTLLNSGNVVFTVGNSPGNESSVSIEKAINDECGIVTHVTVLRRSAVAAAVKENPFATVAKNPSWLLVVNLRDPKAMARVRPLLERKWAPEALALGKRVAYLWCANGVAKSPLWTAVLRVAGKDGTARNIQTMTKLLALLEP